MEYHYLEFSEPLWPTSLLLPTRPPKLIYLDLNQWIQLSKAQSGHRDGKRHRCVLDACLKATEDGRVVFPLSELIYAEIAKNTNHRQRHDLREVIERVSRYIVVTSLIVVRTHEIEAVLDLTVGPRPVPISTTNYLDWGVSRAFGKEWDIRIKSSSGEDITEHIRRTYHEGPEAFDRILIDAQLDFNRRVIEGPNPQEEPNLRAWGWNPEAILQAYEQMASEEQEQARRFDADPKWRRGPIRDAITAREVLIEVGDIFEEGWAARGPHSMDKFFAEQSDDLRSIYKAMPSVDVAVTLKASLHRDPHHKWKNNDSFDVMSMALTIPYCDVVVTDRSMCSHLTRHKLPERYETVVFSQLEELPKHL